MSYFKYNVNPSKRVKMDGVFLGLAGLLLGIFLGFCSLEIPWSRPASPRKTPSIPPLLLVLTKPGRYYLIFGNSSKRKQILVWLGVRRQQNKEGSFDIFSPFVDSRQTKEQHPTFHFTIPSASLKKNTCVYCCIDFPFY